MDFTTQMPVPHDCGCRTGVRLCLQAERLRNRLAAERELAESNGQWDHYHQVMAWAVAHVAQIVPTPRMALPETQWDEYYLAGIAQRVGA